MAKSKPAPAPVAPPAQLGEMDRLKLSLAIAQHNAAAARAEHAKREAEIAASAAQATAQAAQSAWEAMRAVYQLGERDGVNLETGAISRVAAALALLLVLLLSSPASAAICTLGSIGTIAAPMELRHTVGGSSTCDTAVAKGFWSSGDAGGGTFWWDATSTATDNTGTIIQPVGVTGAGRWRRLVDNGALNVRWFGAHCDGTLDDTAAFLGAIAAIEAYPGAAPGGTILVPAVPGGSFCRASQTLVIRRTTILRGESGTNYGYQSRIQWTSAAIDGILIREAGNPDGFRADYSVVQDLVLQGSCAVSAQTLTAAQMDSLTPGAGSAVVIKSPAVRIERNLISGWCQDAISIISSDTQNANYAAARDNFVYRIGRHGFFAGGGNSQATDTWKQRCTGTLNGFCIYDRSMYGGTHVAPATNGAKHSYFCGTSLLNSCTIVGAYQEASDGPGSYGATATIVGGTHANGWTGSPVAAATEVSRGSGLIGGMMRRPAQPPFRDVVRDTSTGFTSFPSFPVTLGTDDTVSYDLTNGNALTTLPTATTANKGGQLTFQVMAGTTTARLRLQVLGGGAINGLTNYDLFAGQAVTVRSKGTTWIVVSKVQ